MKTARLASPKVPAPDTGNHHALVYFSTGDGPIPSEHEGVKLEGVEAVLMRKTAPGPVVQPPGKVSKVRQRPPDYGLYILLGTEWFKAFDIPANEPSVATLRGKFMCCGPSPETVAALKRKAKAGAKLVRAQREYDKITKGE